MLGARFGRTLPTVDLYFAEPLRDLISHAPWQRRRRPIRRLGATTFVCNDTAVIIRYAGRRELDRIRAGRPRRVYYLADDDFLGLAESQELPADYRARLMAFAARDLPAILELADTVVAPNRELLDAYRGKATEILGPAWIHPCPGFRHFAADGPVELAFLGTRSHLGDLEWLAGPLRAFLERRADIALTTFLAGHLPAPLARLGNARHRKPLPWPSYRRRIAKARFHIAIAPARDTRFNRLRSVSKVLDHASVGAAGLYSGRPPFSGIVAAGRDGLLLPDDPAAWIEAIAGLARDRARVQRLAEGGAALARRLGDPAHVRQFWLDRLGLRGTR